MLDGLFTIRFHNLNFVFRQTVKVIDEPVDLPIKSGALIFVVGFILVCLRLRQLLLRHQHRLYLRHYLVVAGLFGNGYWKLQDVTNHDLREGVVGTDLKLFPVVPTYEARVQQTKHE